MKRFVDVARWSFVIVFALTVTALRAEDHDSLAVQRCPEYICADSNRISGNVAALDELFRKWNAVESDTSVVVSILHLGDSHSFILRS